MRLCIQKSVKKWMRFCCALLLFALCNNNSFAQTFKYNTSEASTIVSGNDLYTHGLPTIPDTLVTWCNEWDHLFYPGWGDTLKFKSNNAFVKFFVDNWYLRTDYQTPIKYTYRLVFSVYGYSNPVDTTSYTTNTDTLTISYTNDSDNTPYQDLNLKKYSNFYKLMVVVNTILIDTGEVPLVSANLSDSAWCNFKVEASIVTQHYDKIPYGMGLIGRPIVTAAPSVTNNYLDLNWTLPIGAITPVNYELEWTYVDNYSVSPDTTLTINTVSPSSLSYNFTNNCTRVWLDSNAYRIPLTYSNGYIIYRVRTVRPDSVLYKNPIYGDWSNLMSDAGNVGGFSLSTPYPTCYPITTAFTGDNLNWQYTVSFAEGGKYKQVASFYDGLLKNRQSITRFNSSPNYLIATDNVYDYEGRLSIKTLPAPVITSAFTYQDSVDLNSLTHQPYQASDFDSGLALCPITTPIPPLDTNAKASIYYSHKNPDQLGFQQFVPDAQGYPMVQTIYEPGFTDRVLAQGSAGPRLQIGDTNYTSNAYVSAGQQSLNSLFGPNVGWSSYYRMTVSSDPNQQFSMTIKDYEGKQIASALIGNGPDSATHAITSLNVPSPVFFKQDLLLPSPPNQVVDTIAGTRTADADYFNQFLGTDSVAYIYNLIPFAVCDTHVSVKAHYDCLITDQCGSAVFHQSATFGSNGLTTSAPITYSGTDSSFYALKAPYHVHKTLSYNPLDVTAAMDSFFNNAASCFLTEPYFIMKSVDSADFPCTGADNADSTDCSKMKSQMMQQLFPGAAYAQYSMSGDSAVGTDNSIFSIIGCPPADTFHVTRSYQDSVYVRCYYGGTTSNDSEYFWIWSSVHTKGYIDYTFGAMTGTGLQWSHSSPIDFYEACSYDSSLLLMPPPLTTVLRYVPYFNDNLDSVHGAFNVPTLSSSSCIMNGNVFLSTTSDSFSNENGAIRLLSGDSIGVITSVYDEGMFSGTPSFSEILMPVTITGTSFTANFSAFLPSGRNITIDIHGTIIPVGDSFHHFTHYYVVDSFSGINTSSPLCHYRYRDTCLVSLPASITVNGITYHDLRTMPVDSFIMVYNGALAEGNDSIAMALLPLHPQYCELQNCFNDTFKTQVFGIPNWQVAESINQLYLDSLVAHDPLKTLMVSSGIATSTSTASDSLNTFSGGHIRLDSIILMNAYCGCNDTIMFQQCVANMFSYEIGHHLLINDAVKSSYFNNMVGLYFSNRERFVDKIFMHGGTSCSHCAIARMSLDPAAALFPATYATGDSISSNDSAFLGSGSTGWLPGMFGYSSTALYDSALVLSHYTDSALAYGEIDTIVANLSNCIAGSATLATRIKDTLISIYSSGAAPMGNFTFQQMLYALRINGVSMSDICNPYIINCFQSNAQPSNYVNDCMSDSFYSALGSFISTATVNNALFSIGASYTFSLDTTTNIFEQNVARAFGNYQSTKIVASYQSSTKLYVISIAKNASGSTDTVKIYLHSPVWGSFYSYYSGSADSTGISCINSASSLASATGLINEYSFVATVKNPLSLSVCTMYGWVDSMPTMTYRSNVLSTCIPCTQMKTLYKQFNDTLLHYTVYGTDHPCYDVMLANFMNYNLQQNYTSGDYETFIQSCALADSMVMPEYTGYSSFTFNHIADIDSFIKRLDRVDNNYSFDNSYKDSTLSATPLLTVCINLNTVPVSELWMYKNFLNDYMVYHTKLVNLPFSSMQISGEIGFIYSDTSSGFNPVDPLIIDTATVKFIGPYHKAVWIGGHFVVQNFYDVVANTGTPPYTISKDVYELSAYLYNNSIPGTVFTSNYQSTINSDYFKPEKQAYLNYTYGYQQLPPYNVLDSIQSQYLTARISSYSGYLAGYSQASTPGVFANLYLSNSGMSNQYYDTLQKIINAASTTSISGAGFGSGYIFHSSNDVAVPVLSPMALTAYICGDGSYWYRYFTTGDTLFNVYVAFPDYIPKYLRSSYRVVGVIPTPGDSLNRSFTLNVVRSTTTDTIQIHGRTSFVIGKSIELDNVLLGQVPGGVNVAGADTFDNCERQTLYSAINQGIVAYQNYMDSVKSNITGAFESYIVHAANEQLFLGYFNNEFDYTLYGYDRAGNLSFTAPPAGITPIPNTGILLNQVDTARINNTPSTSPTPAYNKINTYNYNSQNEVVTQQTIDGGKTRFFYDAAGRLIFSQNAKQAKTGDYTYNIFDQQNRIIETGDERIGCPYFDPHGPITHGTPYCHYTYSILVGYIGGGGIYELLWSPDPPIVYNLIQIPYDTVVKQIRSYDRSDVVMTIYDTTAKNLFAVQGLDSQQNLRKRVSCVKYFQNLSHSDSVYAQYNYATHYSYDIGGNVQTLTQDFPELASVKQQYKRVDYDYDLISGKVNMLSYNRGWPDQFYQKYNYDADNRITEVHTSADGYIWKRDAEYSYYEHGPLARIQLGNLAVQGVDYAYTIQGWLKIMNSDTLNSIYDMGMDGISTGVTAPDAVAYSIDYFKNDYKPISGVSMEHVAPTSKSLFNGNIARQTEAINAFQRLNKQYMYDQLNRINKADYASISAVDNTLTGLTDFHNKYSYDADGNIQTLLRYGNNMGAGASVMDSLIYQYSTGGHDNKLTLLNDYAPDGIYAGNNAISSYTGSASRYQYDAIGNTTKDLVSGQDTIKWNLYNKVTGTRNNTSHNNMQFEYDGAGNRVAKYFTQSTDTGSIENDDYYVHDAQGNILAIYKQKEVYVQVPLFWVSHLNQALRPVSGGSSVFNTQFVVPEFGQNVYFEQAVLKYAMQNSDFENAVFSLPVSFFLSHRRPLYYNMLFANTSYVQPLVAAELAGTDTIIGPALAKSFRFLLKDINQGVNNPGPSLSDANNSSFSTSPNNGLTLTPSLNGQQSAASSLQSRKYTNLKEKEGAALQSMNMMQQIFSDSIAGPHALGLLCQVPGGDSILYYIAAAINNSNIGNDTTSTSDTTGSDSTSTSDSTALTDSITTFNCDSLIAIITADSLDPGLLAQAVSLVGDILYPAPFAQYLELIGTDSVIYNAPALQQPMAQWVQAEIAAFGSRRRMIQFFDSDEGAKKMLQQITKPEELMEIAYHAATDSFINAFDAALGDEYIDRAISSLPHLSYRSYLASAASLLGTSVTAAPITESALKSMDFSLAEHDIYGSSRLGVKEYYPQQVGLAYTMDISTGIGTYTDTTRLLCPLPWYSLEYQDVIKTDSLNLYGNTLTDMYWAQHILGQKQYEITDHLGDVLATLSDKRLGGTYTPVGGGTLSAGSPATLNTWMPSVVTAYDYYPFGQYMPGRYMTDTAVHCVTTTITEWVAVNYFIWEPPIVYAHHGPVHSTGGSTVTTVADTAIQIVFDSSGGGAAFTVSGFSTVPGSSILLNIPYVTGDFTATLTDDSGNVIGQAEIAATQGNSSLYSIPIIGGGDGGGAAEASTTGGSHGGSTGGGGEPGWGGGTITGGTIAGGNVMAGTITGTTTTGDTITGGTITGGTIIGGTISGTIVGTTTGGTTTGGTTTGGTTTGTITGATITGGIVTGITVTGGTITGGTIGSGDTLLVSTISGSTISGTTITGGTVTGGTTTGFGSGTITITGTVGVLVIVLVAVPEDSLVLEDVVSTVCNTEHYRYGFNGQLKNNEWAGLGNHMTAQYWEYSTQTGRRYNQDPVSFPSLSSYSVLGDNPNYYVDPDGALFNIPGFGSTSEQRQAARDYKDQHGGDTRRKWHKDIHNHTPNDSHGQGNGVAASYPNHYFTPEGRDGGHEFNPEMSKFNDYVADKFHEEDMKKTFGIYYTDRPFSTFDYEQFFIPLPPIFKMAGSFGKIAETETILYHYTSQEAANNILKDGLDASRGASKLSYLTNTSELTPFQAKIELALPSTKPMPTSLLRIDATGIKPVMIRRVTGNLPGLGAGGGTEYLFDQFIPANKITQIPMK